MLQKLRTHLMSANVMATVAVFVALGGSSYGDEGDGEERQGLVTEWFWSSPGGQPALTPGWLRRRAPCRAELVAS